MSMANDVDTVAVPHDAAARPQQLGFVAEIWMFLEVRKKFWLAPIILVLMLLGGLFTLTAAAGPWSPFLYGGF